MDNDYGSYYTTQPAAPNKNKILIIVGGVLLVVAVILLIVSLLVNKNAPSTKKEEEETTTTQEIPPESDTKELKIDDIATIQGIWDAASLESGGEISSVACQKLISYGNSFASKYGGSMGSSDLCSYEYITISIETADEYPFGDTSVIRVKDSNQCLNFSFFSGFFSLYSYNGVPGYCAGEAKEIRIVGNV